MDTPHTEFYPEYVTFTSYGPMYNAAMNKSTKDLDGGDFFYRELPNVIQIVGFPLLIVSYLFKSALITSIALYFTVWFVRGYLDSQIKSYEFEERQRKSAKVVVDIFVIATWFLLSAYLLLIAT